MKTASSHPALRRHHAIEDYAEWKVKGVLASAYRAYVFSDMGEVGDGEVMSVAYYRCDEDNDRWYADAGDTYSIEGARALWAELKRDGYARVA